MDDHQQFPAALAIDALGSDARAAFALSADAGYRAIAFATNHPELSPDALGPSARRQVKTILAARHLGIDSLRAAAPRSGLADPATIDRTLDNARKAMTLAHELGIGTVSLNIGALGTPHPASPPVIPESTIISALRQLAQQADASGVALALSADGTTDALARVLKAVDFDRAKINLEGARAIGGGENILAALEAAAGMIGQLTASDAVKSGNSARTVELGNGQLPLRELINLLREQGFIGPWVVDVRDLADAAAGAQHAAEILRRMLS